MACYYLVISSTHLSNGHLRSIKGVFRGPLCASGGAESPQDYAGKEKAITKALENLKANFYCELCDKQYHKHQEFDNHINSYDHAHKQRLKELKQREFARNVSSKSWKDEKKQEKALKRLHQIALLKQQTVSDKERKTKLLATDRDKQHEKIKLNGSDKSGTETILHDDQNHSSPSSDLTTKTSPFAPVLTNQRSVRVKCSSLLSQTPKGHRHAKPGISFGFSKRAHLKLDSSASVFTDGMDETSDHQEVRRQRQKLALQALLSRSPSPTQDVPLDPMPSNPSPQKDLQTDHPNQEDSLEMQVMYCTIEPQGRSCLEVGRQAADNGQKSRQEKPYEELIERSSLENPRLDGHNNVTPGQHSVQYSNQDLQKSSKQDNSITDDCLAEGDHGNKTFFNVLGKDGTELKWPGELVQYTSDEPSVSYSCNPLLLNFKCPEGDEKSTGPEQTDVNTISDQASGAEEQIPNISKDNLGILKPKKHKHRQRGKIRLCKIDAIRRHRVACALGNFSRSPAEGQFKFNSTPVSKLPSKQNCTEKRHKLRNRKRSQGEPQQLHLKSIIVNAFSAPQRRRRKRQRLRSALRLAKRKALLHAPVQSSFGNGENHLWCEDFCKSKRDANVTPLKSSSWGVFSEMRSDGGWPACQWERHLNSYASPSYYPRRRGYNQPCSYVRKSRYSFPYYGYRHMPGSQGEDTELGEEYCNYRNSEVHKERNYYGVCDGIIKQRYGIRRHKRNLRENRYRDYANPLTKRICFYRVDENEDENDPHDTQRDWWCERPSPDLRRRKRRNRFWLRSVVSQDRGNEQSSVMLRHSPAPSSITSLSEISGDCGTFMKRSCFGDLKWPEERSGRTKPSHSRERTPREKIPPTSTSIKQSEVVQSDTRPGKLEPCAQNPKSSDLTKQSTTHKKLVNNKICTLSLPLIGKLPSIKKGIRRAGTHKDTDGSGACCRQVKTYLHDRSKPESQAEIETARKATQNSTLSQACPSSPDQRPEEACPSSTDQRTAEACPNPDTHNDGHMSLYPKRTADKSPGSTQSCLTPPLTEKPITFTEEEMDKYRLLQLQAQQHMQQKLREQHDRPRSSFVSQTDQLPIPSPEPLNQTVPAPCLSYAIHQHGSLSALSSFISSPSVCLAPHGSPSVHPPLRPTLPQSHFTPFPFPTVFYPASPTVMLATHPVQLISAAPFHHSHPHSHIAGLTLHPTPHASLLHSMLTPAAMVAGRSMQIHPAPQPLFARQEVHHHSGIAS